MQTQPIPDRCACHGRCGPLCPAEAVFEAADRTDIGRGEPHKIEPDAPDETLDGLLEQAFGGRPPDHCPDVEQCMLRGGCQQLRQPRRRRAARHG